VAVSNEGGHLATVAAGETWSIALPSSAPRKFAPRVSRGTSAKDCARFAADKQLQERLQCYREQARGRGPDSERAQYQLARLLRDGLGDLAAALSAFELQRSRFPRGDLKIEADRAIIELLQRLGRHAEALAETQMFLDENPDAEYRAEIRLIRGDIYRAIFRDPMSAEREYDEGAGADGRTGDDSRFLRALCLEALGRLDEALLAYKEYLAQAGTAHAREAKRRMEHFAR
jgi:tetratricopeptide (TPR) repeat protein